MKFHTYHEEGTYFPTVTVTDNQNDPALQDSFEVDVSDPSVIGSGATISPIPQGVATGPVVVATFTDPGGAEPNQYTPGEPKVSAHYSATINWGDGTSSSPDIQQGTITYQSGSYVARQESFTVTGASHIYYAPGDYTITVTIDHETSTPTVVHDSIEVTEQDKLSVQGFDQDGNPGQPLTNVTVGSFIGWIPVYVHGSENDGDPPTTAEINWGYDGTAFVPDTITSNGQGGYNITGTHTYTSPGDYEITLFVDKNGQPNDYAYGF